MIFEISTDLNDDFVYWSVSISWLITRTLLLLLSSMDKMFVVRRSMIITMSFSLYTSFLIGR